MKYFFKKNASDNQFFFVLANFCHLTTNIKSSAIHTKDFCARLFKFSTIPLYIPVAKFG
jgi:hypothetical protein